MRYTVYAASGNPTALVWSSNMSEAFRKQINDEIMESNASVEQVGFLLPRTCGIMYPGVSGTTVTGNFVLQMAGGEFCANAARCAIYAYLGGEDGTIDLTVSGAERPVRGSVFHKGDRALVSLEMPVISKAGECITPVSDGAIVRLHGISHLVISKEDSKSYLAEHKGDELKEPAMAMLKKYKLHEEPAAGVIFLCDSSATAKEDTALAIQPVVYVKAVDTLFCETACGTGTTAAALAIAAKAGEGLELSVEQPYGESITVNVIYNKRSRSFGTVTLSGPIDELQEKNLGEM